MIAIDALVAGEMFVDLILGGFDSWPQPGHESYAREFRRDIGGGASITAAGLATLGTRTGIFGIVGSDHHDWIVRRLEERGVDTSDLLTDPIEPTAFTVAVSAPEDRAFFTYLGANKKFWPLLEEAALTRHFKRARHIHLAYAPPWEKAASLFEEMHSSGCTLSVDAGWHEEWLADPRALRMISAIDLFFPNELEAARMTGERDPEKILRRFQSAGLKRVALKLGRRGGGVLWDGEIFFEPPPPVIARDTTGAGDCFDAGFLNAWLCGAPPRQCLRAANICGALSTQAFGGIAGFPVPEQLHQLLDQPS
jgi:ribokinase